MTTIKNTEEFNKIVNSGKPVFIDFYAEWCGPCQSLMPTVEELSQEFDGKVEMLKVNVDQNQELASKFQVRSIPALFFIKDKKINSMLNGMQSKGVLREKLTKISA